MHVQAISRFFGEVAAVQDLTFSVRSGEFLSFVGPSGAGKTTLLRILAGIDVPDSGMVEYAESIGNRHPCVLVFQDYLLFPHMTVFDNVAFGLRSRRRRDRLSRGDLSERVERYLGHLGILEKARAFPAQLSAGQKQRVALARALVLEPGLLLLDEPFANLDRRLKGDTAFFLRDLQRRLNVTTIAVSHDLDETLAVSDRVGVIIDGRLEQLDRPGTVESSPVSAAVAKLFARHERIDEEEEAL